MVLSIGEGWNECENRERRFMFLPEAFLGLVAENTAKTNTICTASSSSSLLSLPTSSFFHFSLRYDWCRLRVIQRSIFCPLWTQSRLGKPASRMGTRCTRQLYRVPHTLTHHSKRPPATRNGLTQRERDPVAARSSLSAPLTNCATAAMKFSIIEF
jgi:hypothetical protein